MVVFKEKVIKHFYSLTFKIVSVCYLLVIAIRETSWIIRTDFSLKILTNTYISRRDQESLSFIQKWVSATSFFRELIAVQKSINQFLIAIFGFYLHSNAKYPATTSNKNLILLAVAQVSKSF